MFNVDSNTVIALLTAASLLVAGSIWFGRIDDQVATTLKHVDALEVEVRVLEHQVDGLAKHHEPPLPERP